MTTAKINLIMLNQIKQEFILNWKFYSTSIQDNFCL
jgi:hypothetical protein